MARIYPLFSSSKGNSTFIGTEKGGILIDCGVSLKRLSAALELNNIPLSAVMAVFITHEHSDHIASIGVLARKYGLPMYATAGTIKGITSQKGVGLIDMSLFKEISADTSFMIDFCRNQVTVGPGAAQDQQIHGLWLLLQMYPTELTDYILSSHLL